MRVRRLIPVLSLVLLGTAAWAHIPVMVADPVWARKGKVVVLSHAYGHPHQAEWMPCARPERVLVHAPSGAEHDLSGSLESFDAAEHRKWRARFTPDEPGDHVAELRARSRIGKTRFDDVIKVVIHAGGAPGGWDRELGAPVEFVPLTRPYALPKGASFRARLLSGGKPLANAIVGVEHMNDAPPKKKVPSELHMVRQERTNAQGELCVTLPKKGWWVLFASVPGAAVEEDGETLSRKDRGSFWVRVGW